MSDFIIAFGLSLIVHIIFTHGRSFLHYYSYNETEKRKEKKINDFRETVKRNMKIQQLKEERTMKEKVDAIMAMQDAALKRAGYENFLSQEEIDRMRDRVLSSQIRRTRVGARE
jgi:hypothetical protein